MGLAISASVIAVTSVSLVAGLILLRDGIFRIGILVMLFAVAVFFVWWMGLPINGKLSTLNKEGIRTQRFLPDRTDATFAKR